jgi:predicted regulator of Ras-like GTPase activity (Roadblock/LC7/MglB family)
MTLPFLDFFKKAKTQIATKKERSAPAEKPALAPLEKPESDRFSKTVMPNATRTVPPQDPFQMAARSTGGGSMASATATAPASTGSRTISFGGQQPAARQRDLPPAVALALEPRVERVISLDIADVVAHMPEGYVRPLSEADSTRRILLKASEVEKGMATGKPAVSVATIYQQVPEIFLRTVPPADTTQVHLPFQKVLEQFTSLQVRRDQERHQAVPQVETPFLKVTLEDNSTFGTTMEAVETGDLPAVRVELPTAQAFAAAEPEPAAASGMAQPSAEKTQVTPTRIPFKITPNGTDAPVTESVPASNRPSVPTSLAAPPVPVRIPFKMTAPSDDLRPPQEPWLTAESMKAEAPAVVPKPASKTEMKIGLPLKPILQALPPFQLSGDPASVPEEARAEFPFSLIEPQLAVGRIAVTPKVFEASIPEEYRSLFKADEAGDVILPLQEVLKNLPTASLRMRDDQEEQDAGANFATPFSAKAEEDAKRLNVAGTPVAKPMEEPVAVTPAETAAVVPAAEPLRKPFDVMPRNPLQVALGTDEKLDAKGVVAHINKISGVKACAIMFGDGLSLAGSLPPEIETDGLCAMAPSLMQRIETHMVDTKLGALRGMTLACTKGAVTFFMHENLCLAALHSNGDLTPDVREKLSRVVHELSRKYTHHPV